MSNTFIGKTDDELKKEVMQIAKEEMGIRNFKSVGVLRGFLEVFTRVLRELYRKFISPIYKQTNLDSATGEWLSQWGLLLGVSRKPSTKTEGVVNLVSYDDGEIEKGTWITVVGTKLRFKVLMSVKFGKDEDVLVPVEAEFPGSKYNVSGEDLGALAKVVAGVESITFKDGWITKPGIDVEDDESYRNRIKNRWISEGVGNPPPSFYFYAQSVEGVKEVKLIRTPRGYGTVDVIVVADNGLPGKELLQKVYDAMYDHALICNDLQVKAPSVKNTAVKVAYSGQASANEIEESVMQYIYSLGIGGRLEIRGIYDVLERFELDKAEVLEPFRDVQAEEDSIVVADVRAVKE